VTGPPKAHALACALSPLAWHAAVPAADDIVTRPVQFARGASSATVKGQIQGYQSVDHTLRARAGQTMKVELNSANSGLAFNVLPPGSKDAAIPDAIAQLACSGALPEDGIYTIRTDLPRAAARQGEKASFSLTVAITGAAAAPATSGDDSALAKATDPATAGRFNATGEVPCAQAKAQPMRQRAFGVARAGGGTAVVVITKPDGRKRSFFFDKGKASFADLSQADGNMEFRVTKQEDLFRIDAGNERYEIPEAVINGR
jgi:hypothetical protein